MVFAAPEHDGFEDDLEALHGADGAPGFNGFGDLFVEDLPVVEGPNLQEFEEGEEFFDVVLPVGWEEMR